MASTSTLSSREALDTELEAVQQALLSIDDDREQLEQLSSPQRLAQARIQFLEGKLSHKLLEWTNGRKDDESLSADISACIALGDLLFGVCTETRRLSIYENAAEEYQELLSYCRGQLLLTLRRILSAHKYPEAKSTKGLVRELKDPESLLSTTSKSLEDLQSSENHVVGTPSTAAEPFLMEWMRPLLERTRYHFINPAKPIKVERLPNLVCAYLRETLESVWKVHSHMDCLLGRPWSVSILNEVVQLLQSVFEHYHFFRHDVVIGPESNPEILARSIEELLRFDSFVNQLCGESKDKVISIVDAQVSSDSDLLDWWLVRERERCLGLLTEAEQTSSSAEVFGALLHSIQQKSCLVFEGPYLREVLSPACVQFLDQIHAAATDLRRLLLQKSANLADNLMCWFQMFEGVQMCQEQIRIIGREDLLRFGESLDKWETVWKDTLTSLLVESIIMERCKVAQYLLQCSHLLSSPGTELVASVDLSAAGQVLLTFAEACSSSQSALTNALRDAVYQGVAHEFTSILLNHDGMTPVLYSQSATLLHDDLQTLLGEEVLPPSCLALLEMVKLASKDFGLQDAVFALTNDWSIESFASDSRLADEALSMIRAKGFVWIELADVLNILSRRSIVSASGTEMEE